MHLHRAQCAGRGWGKPFLAAGRLARHWAGLSCRFGPCCWWDRGKQSLTLTNWSLSVQGVTMWTDYRRAVMVSQLVPKKFKYCSNYSLEEPVGNQKYKKRSYIHLESVELPEGKWWAILNNPHSLHPIPSLTCTSCIFLKEIPQYTRAQLVVRNLLPRRSQMTLYVQTVSNLDSWQISGFVCNLSPNVFDATKPLLRKCCDSFWSSLWIVFINRQMYLSIPNAFYV